MPSKDVLQLNPPSDLSRSWIMLLADMEREHVPDGPDFHRLGEDT